MPPGVFLCGFQLVNFRGKSLAQQGQQDGKGSPVTLCEHADW
jgi:hypothetical protein